MTPRQKRTSEVGDRLPCFVRVTNGNRHGFVEFQFALGTPDLYLEMTLPPAAFREFCAQHRAIHLPPEFADTQTRPSDEDEAHVD